MERRNSLSRHSPLHPLIVVCGLCVILMTTACASKKSIIIPPSTPVQTTSKAGAVVGTARALVGTPYRAGGLDPGTGFDCSGFIWWVYQQHGITLPRTTADQANSGIPVNGTTLQPADILVFRTGSGMHGLHTAVYTGNGAFVHSPKPGAVVREESLAIPYWSRNFIAARRIVTP